MRGLLLALPAIVATPATAQMQGMTMPGMTMPMPMKKPAAKAVAKSAPAKRAAPARKKTEPTPVPTQAPPTRAIPASAVPEMAMPGMAMPLGTQAPVAADPCPPEHAAMGHCTPALPPAPAATERAPAGTDQDAGDAPAPPAPTTRAADAFYDPATMAMANRMMRDEHGGMTLSQVIFNLAEVQPKRGGDGYRWDGEGWFGGNIHRFVVKSEGEGTFGDRVEAAEVQALYSRTLDPYWNMQAGVRQDVGAGAKRTYATVGVEGLAPYWFDVEGALFLSDRGDVLARGEAWYDQRITQRAILQPRVEFNLAAQDMPASRIGAGLSSAEVGLRLRYEIARTFAPYVGVSWERRYGATARFARADGQDTGGFALVLGIRGWF